MDQVPRGREFQHIRFVAADHEEIPICAHFDISKIHVEEIGDLEGVQDSSAGGINLRDPILIRGPWDTILHEKKGIATWMISPADDVVGPEISSQRGQDGAGLFIHRVNFGRIRFPIDEAYDLAISYFNLARAYRLAGNFSQTIINADAAIEVMSKLSAKSPDDADYKRNLAIYKTEMARAQIALSQSDKAITALDEVQAILQPIVKADQASATSQGDLGMAYRLSAQAHHQKGENRKAAELVGKAINVVQELKERHSLKDSEKDLLAELEKEKTTYNE